MYDLLSRMFRSGKLDLAGLDRAVTKGWITVVQRDEIADGAVGVL